MIVSLLRSNLSTSKRHPELRKMSFSEAIEYCIIIASQSNINPKDARMDAIREFRRTGRVGVDKKRIESLARKILMGLEE